MNLKRKQVYFQADGGNGGGGGGIQPAEARTFVQQFVPDPKVLEDMDDKGVLDYHTRLSATLDKVRPKAAAAWPEKWREELAGNDEKALQQLGRYSTPGDVWKKARELEAKVTSGELRSLPPKDATPEAMAAWRTQNGIPVAADKYDLKLKDGIVIGAEDKPIIDGILGRLHAKNVSNEQASELVNAYYDQIENTTKEQARITSEKKAQVAEALNKKWGGDYVGNNNRIAALVDANLPAESGLKAKILNEVATNQEFAELMESLARQVNPVGVLIPGADTNSANALADQIKEIKGWMAAGRGTPEGDKYWKDEKVQERYRQLLAAQESIGQKAG